MLQKTKLFFFLCCALSIYALSARLYDNTLIIHPFISSTTSCTNCHIKGNINVIIDNPAKACSVQCLTCHKDMKNHHVIDVKINEKLPEKLTLTEKNKITCITCHNLTAKRFDITSWKAESLYEKIFKTRDQYKTYYLINKNNNGQLCKICH